MLTGLILLLAVGGVLLFTLPIVRSVVYFVFWRLLGDATFSSAYVDNNGVRIHYRSCGDGPVLVLLHGGLSSTLDWIGEIPTLTKNFRLILVDARGHGRSELGAQALTYGLMAADVVAVLDDAGIDRAHVAGWSDGGNVGLLLAVDFPSRVGRLIAISANFHPDGLVEEVVVQPEGSPGGTTSRAALWLHQLLFPTPEKRSVLVQRVTTLWASYPQLTSGDLNGVTTPTLVIVGSDDYVELAHSQEMVLLIQDSALVVVPGIGHSVTRDAPSRVSDEIINFLV